jgi:hypothetical protein
VPKVPQMPLMYQVKPGTMGHRTPEQLPLCPGTEVAFWSGFDLGLKTQQKMTQYNA